MELASEGSRFFLDELKVSSKAYVLSNEGLWAGVGVCSNWEWLGKDSCAGMGR